MPVRCCLIAEVDGQLGSKKPFPQTPSLYKERTGVVVNGSLACGCTIARRSRVLRDASSPCEAPRCEATRGGRSRRRRRAETRGPWRATPRMPGLGKTCGRRESFVRPRVGCAIAARKSGGRAAHPLSIEGVPDRGRSCRFTAAWSKRSRRLSLNRSARSAKKRAKKRCRYRVGLRQGRQRLGRVSYVGQRDSSLGEDLGKSGRTRPHGDARSAEAFRAS